jgi:hypothetical protein
VGVCLTDHVVVIEGSAPCADEERCTHQRRRAGADLFDLGDRVGEGGCVNQSLLVEAGGTGPSEKSRIRKRRGTYTGLRAAILKALLKTECSQWWMQAEEGS